MNFKSFHKLSYGMYLIASEFRGKKSGYIANTAFQVTSEPHQIAISCHKDNLSAEVILQSGFFSLSVLKQEVDMKIVGNFGFKSSAELDKFSGIRFTKGKTGAPIVTESAVAWFECRVTSSADLGTHYLIVGEVVDAEILSDEEPLTYQYYREKYKMFSPKNSPTYLDKSIIEVENPATSGSSGEPEHEHFFDGENYVCMICGYTYHPDEGDPSAGIPPGTAFEDLPEDYRCPVCNATKEYFKKV